MTRPGDPGTLQWDSFDRLTQRMVRALSEDPSRDLGSLLPPPTSPRERLVALHEMIKLELEFRWGRQRPVTLEDYLRRFPELGTPATLPVALVFAEYRARHLFGDRPSLDGYKERFPDQFEGLVGELHTQPVASPAGTNNLLTKECPSPEQATPVPPPLTQVPATLVPSGQIPLQLPSIPSMGDGPKTLVRVGGGYEMLQRIGRGEFGEVFKARAPGGGLVALKRVFRPLDDTATQRELRALDLVCRLNHPFLLQTQLYWVDEGHLVIVMELADGSLGDWLKECQGAGLTGIPVDPLLRYFLQAAEALDFLHSQQPPVIHRDVKPANLLRVKGFAKVADFGLARETQAQSQNMAAVTTCGTPAFMPPEMWSGRVHANSDQYSLAVTYVEMRLGRHCFTGKNIFEIMSFQHGGGLPDLTSLPPAEQEVLKRALAREPDQRFPTCVAFAQALKETTAPPTPVVPAQGRGVKVAVASLAFALAAVLIALGVVLAWPRPPASVPSQQLPLPAAVVDWQPEGWAAVNSQNIVPDRRGRRYYGQLQRDLGGQTVVMILIPQKAVSDPPTFYIMQNKVWNDLYAAFLKDPESQVLLRKYSSYPGCETLVRGAWVRGAMAPALPAEQLGVAEGQGRVPVFCVTATEGVCLAEWIGGRLPNQEQYYNAADLDDLLPGVFKGDPNGLALNLGKGPWEVDRGDRDVNRFGCRQMVSNGREYTRTLQDSLANEELPLRGMTVKRRVRVVGVSYLAQEPPTRDKLFEPDSIDCTDFSHDIGVRVVLEQQ